MDPSKGSGKWSALEVQAAIRKARQQLRQADQQLELAQQVARSAAINEVEVGAWTQHIYVFLSRCTGHLADVHARIESATEEVKRARRGNVS